MKRIEPEAIGDVLRLTIQEANMASRLDECRAADLWSEIMGKGIASRTSRPRVSCGVMVVDTASASLRHELHMNRSRIMALINDRIGKETVREIRFTGPSR